MAKQRYSKEFKLEALRLLREEGASAQSVADDLGINVNSLYAWKKKFDESPEAAFPGQGNKSEEQLEIERLRRELKEAQTTIEILEEASKYFAQFLGKRGKRR